LPRTPKDSRIETVAARARLRVRSEPYWRSIAQAVAIGYRKSAGASAWILRSRSGGKYAERRIATPDDQLRADGEVVLTYHQAVERARSMAAEVAQAAPRYYGDSITLNDVFDRYIEARTSQPGGRQGRLMSEYNARLARRSWTRYTSAGIGAEPVQMLTAEKLRAWHASIASQAPTTRGKPMPFDASDADQVRARRHTANRQLANLKAALTWARGAELLPASMADSWTRVKKFQLGEDPIPRMLTQSEVTRLLNSAAPDLRALLTGALMTGARVGDLARLRVIDYDADNGVVRLEQGKTGKLLWQPLTDEGRAFFERSTAGKRAEANIFERADGSRWAQADHLRPMREAAQRAGLEGVSFKVTRATYGKLLLLATRDIELVARALGHSDSRITRKHYAAHLPGEVARGIQSMPALGIDTTSNVRRLRPSSAVKGAARAASPFSAKKTGDGGRAKKNAFSAKSSASSGVGKC
jgi:integrase